MSEQSDLEGPMEAQLVWGQHVMHFVSEAFFVVQQHTFSCWGLSVIGGEVCTTVGLLTCLEWRGYVQ